jgi:rhodanese-related sulfurtransferase
MINNRIKLLSLLLLLGILISTVVARVEDNRDYKSSGPYCGVYCLYSASRLLGINVDFEDLFKPEYISSYKGSTFSDLVSAANRYDIYAEPIQKFTVYDLHNAKDIIILHMKSIPTSKTFEHFSLFIGVDNGKAIIFDPPNKPSRVSFRELAPLWDGTGLIVSDVPIDLSAYVSSSRKRYASYLLAVLVVVLVIRKVMKHESSRFSTLGKRKRMLITSKEVVIICVVAIMAGIFYHYFSEIGFLSNREGTKTITKAYEGSFIPEVSLDDFVSTVHQGNAVLIDARFKLAFDKSHISNAVNIPVSSSHEKVQNIMSEVGKNESLIVYCQSKGCVYDQKIAIKLIELGYSNVSIFKDGWRGWEKYLTSLKK